jgi:hypothetical protein
MFQMEIAILMKGTRFSLPDRAAFACRARQPQQAQANREPHHLEKAGVIKEVGQEVMDHATPCEALAYPIMGARMGYKDRRGWAVFLEGRNLTDENWVSNTAPTTQGATANPAIFNPGYDRSLFAGVSIDVF